MVHIRVARLSDEAKLFELARAFPTPTPPDVDMFAVALRANNPFEYLGEEHVDDSHFNLDPALATNRWYRTVTPAGTRFFTLRLSATGMLLGALIEE